MTPSTIETYSGQLVDILAPHPTDIKLIDIAHSLANLARFNGHTRGFYSVAQHSLNVAALVDPQHRMAALLHDAHEAYTGDIISPVKAALGDVIINIQSGLDRAIHEALMVEATPGAISAIESADKTMLHLEHTRLFNAPKVWPGDKILLDIEVSGLYGLDRKSGITVFSDYYEAVRSLL